MWSAVTGVEENIFVNIKLFLCQIWRCLLEAIKNDRTRADTILPHWLSYTQYEHWFLRSFLTFSFYCIFSWLWLFILMMIMILCNGDIWRSHPSSIKVQCQFMSIISNIFTLPAHPCMKPLCKNDFTFLIISYAGEFVDTIFYRNYLFLNTLILLHHSE